MESSGILAGTAKTGVRRSAFRADPRTYLVCVALAIAAVVLVRSEAGLATVFAAALIANTVLGQGKFVIGYIVAYAMLVGVAWIGTQMLIDNPTNALGLSLGSMGAIGRRMLVPFSFIMGLAEQPTGSVLAAFRALRMPKAAGIGLAVILRFFPTIGEEYRSIRRSQKFRGVGLGVANTLAHLPSTIECIVVPLVIRTTRVSDELSASITVRGVRFGGETISYRPLGFALRGGGAMVVLGIGFAGAWMLSLPGGVLA